MKDEAIEPESNAEESEPSDAVANGPSPEDELQANEETLTPESGVDNLNPEESVVEHTDYLEDDLPIVLDETKSDETIDETSVDAESDAAEATVIDKEEQNEEVSDYLSDDTGPEEDEKDDSDYLSDSAGSEEVDKDNNAADKGTKEGDPPPPPPSEDEQGNQDADYADLSIDSGDSGADSGQEEKESTTSDEEEREKEDKGSDLVVKDEGESDSEETPDESVPPPSPPCKGLQHNPRASFVYLLPVCLFHCFITSLRYFCFSWNSIFVLAAGQLHVTLVVGIVVVVVLFLFLFLLLLFLFLLWNF
jgi:hypothetical protein